MPYHMDDIPTRGLVLFYCEKARYRSRSRYRFLRKDFIGMQRDRTIYRTSTSTDDSIEVISRRAFCDLCLIKGVQYPYDYDSTIVMTDYKII